MSRIADRPVLIFLLLCLSLPGYAVEQRDATGGTTDGAIPGPGLIDPFVELLIRQASDYLALADSLSLHAESVLEEVLPSGQRLHYSRSADILARKPDRLRAEVLSDRGVTRFYYDGRTLSRFDLGENVYARIAVPDTIETALDHAMERFHLDAPLADFLAGNLYDNLLGKAEAAFYAGLHYLEGEKYHHLALSNNDVDYQVWIAEGEAPLVRKIVITYKHIEGSPQLSAVLSGWDLDPLTPDMLFDFYPPIDADEIEFLPVATAAGEVKQ